MTVAYAVQVDPAQIAEATAFFEFVGGNTDDAMRIAINRGVRGSRVLASRTIRDQVRLGADYVNTRLITTKASRKNLRAAIKAERRGLLLSRFSTDPLVSGDKVSWIKPPLVPPRGIRVKIKPDGSSAVVAGSENTRPNKPFYIILNKGRNIGIAARLSGYGSRSRKVEVFYGPSLSQVFDTVRKDITPEASKILQEELLDAMRYLLVKQYPPEPVE